MYIAQKAYHLQGATFPKLFWIKRITCQILAAFFFFLAEIDKLILKFIWKCKGFRIYKIILEEKQNWRAHIHLGFITYYRTTVIRTVCYRHMAKDKQRDQCNRIESRYKPSNICSIQQGCPNNSIKEGQSFP